MLSTPESTFGVADPVALVTGSGAHRVGQVIARAFCERGYRTVFHAHRSLEPLHQVVDTMNQRGYPALAVAADLCDESQIARMFAQVQERWGRLDVLINSAAIWNRKAFEDTDAADLRENFEVNTVGTFLCCKYASRQMIPQAAGGAIVNLGDWAIVRPYEGYSAYFPSKGAVSAMTRSLAVELALRNPRIRVNAILPGPVMFPEGMSEQAKQAIIADTVLKQAGRPEHVAQAAVFLAEHDYLTGVSLPVDGGRTIASQEKR